MYVDLLYGPNSFRYQEIQIPQPEVPGIGTPQAYINLHKNENLSWDEAFERVKQNLHKIWEEKYGNVTKLYSLDIYPTESETSSKRGWALKVICKIPDRIQAIMPGSGIQTYLIFPAKVSFKKNSPLLQGFIPTVETAVEESLNFTIKNEKSDLQPYFSRGSTYNLIERMKKVVDNEYYYFEEDEFPIVSYYKNNNHGYEPYENGGMYNGYYEVTFKQTQPTTYSIKRVDESIIQSDKYTLMAIYIAISTLIAIIAFTLIYKKQHK